ncbi:MAG: cupredoxin domain-containing protein [Proteobacteria bacterium]|nr:cupredoxin domain-containing protein [Pseudomonadota bacterium]
MSALSRRSALKRLGIVLASAGTMALVAGSPRAQGQAGRIIEIEARRFRFTPNEIKIKRGEVVTLALRAVDFPHGFNLPDLSIRADLIPGQVVTVRIQAVQPGRFAFLCDNFCGEHHEEMSGTLIVDT